MNAHDAVIQAVLGLLRQAPAVTAGPIEEDIDLDTVPATATEAVAVALQDSTPQEVVFGEIDWTTHLTVHCYARNDTRAASGRASRVLHQKVMQRLLADRTLGGVALQIAEPRITQNNQQADTRAAELVALYTVQHRTAAGSLEAA